MSTVTGIWAVEIDTPMGTQRFTLDLTESEGAVTGTATNNAGGYDVEDGALAGDRLTFGVHVASPFPIALAFTLDVDGDTLSGESKAGPFPPSRVTGRRAA